MAERRMVWLFVLMLFGAVACDEDPVSPSDALDELEALDESVDQSETLEPCAEVSCSQHGSCVVQGGAAVCDCDAGYEAQGLDCVLSDPCAGVLCSGRGSCVVEEAAPTCSCDQGYEAQGLECLSVADPCMGVLCSGHGQCVLEQGVVSCDCDEGYEADGLQCLEPFDPCEGVLCSGHGQCVAVGEQASCNCEQGYFVFELECLAPGSATVVITDIHSAAGGQDRVNLREMTHAEDLGDYDLIVAMNPGVGPIIMLGPDVRAQNLGNLQDFHEVQQAPSEGYATDSGSTLVIGASWRDGGTGSTGFHMSENVYVLQLANSSYAKLEVLSAKSGKIDILAYHQPNASTLLLTVE